MPKPKEFYQGDKGETSIIELLSSADIMSVKPEKPTKLYDIIIKLHEDYTAEIKTDIMGKHTGNLALEFWNSRKNEPSGISVSSSDLWFHIFADEIYLANTLELKIYIQNNTPDRIFFNAGDKNANIYLYKANRILKDVFINLSKPYKDIKEILKEKLPK